MGARSKGCLTCKRRKIKCTEEHPSCKQCFKSNRECGGYGLVVRFVDENRRIHRKEEVEMIQINELFTITHTMNTSIPHQDFIEFLLMKLRGSNDCCGVGSNPSVWVKEMENVSSKSLGALGAIFYGLANHVQDIVVLALGMYGHALAEMRRNLASGERAVDFKTLASITALCMFELANSRSSNGWILHAQSLERMLDASEPPTQKNTPMHSLFLIQRTLLVSQAIVTERRTILSQPKWKTIPWDDDHASKLPYERLIDIYCDIAEVRSDVKDLRCVFEVSRHKAALKKATELLADLDTWWRLWMQNHPTDCWEVEAHAYPILPSDHSGPLYSRLLEYSSIDAAYTICSYNGARILLLQALEYLSGTTQATNAIASRYQGGFPQLELHSDPERSAHDILRSIEYCSIQAEHFMGSFSTVLILDIAYSALPKNSRASRWLLENSRVKYSSPGESNAIGVKQQTGFTMLGSCQVFSRLQIQPR